MLYIYGPQITLKQRKPQRFFPLANKTNESDDKIICGFIDGMIKSLLMKPEVPLYFKCSRSDRQTFLCVSPKSKKLCRKAFEWLCNCCKNIWPESSCATFHL